jgi:hypothetical protein
MNQFDGAAYDEAVANAIGGQSGEVRGRTGGYLTLKSRGTAVDFEITNSGTGPLRRSLQLVLQTQIESFALK